MAKSRHKKSEETKYKNFDFSNLKSACSAYTLVISNISIHYTRLLNPFAAKPFFTPHAKEFFYK